MAGKGQFPDTFWWGTASSSPQSEGAAPASDWLAWERGGHVPASADGNGFAVRYEEDFRLYADFGLTHHRLGIDWSRIEPEEGLRDAAAIEHYRAVLEAAHAAGIEPWVCLHHFVLPTWVAPDGVGFCDEKARTYYWRRHVEFVAETFGDLVFGWQPVNEPVVYAANGFLAGVNPPGLRDFDRAMEAAEGAHLANFAAWDVLRQTDKPVATIHALYPAFPFDDSEASRTATERADDIIWGSWIRAMRDGRLQLPGREPIDMAGFVDAFDMVGFSYYSALAVSADMVMAPYPPDARLGLMGYAPWSAGLGLVIDRLVEELPGKPLLIAEHGVGTEDDAWRCEILRESLDLVADRLASGVDIRGFFHWTGVDNYEWAQGWTVPFGVFDRDRTPRPSAHLLEELATCPS
jgi:beta-glucosidase